ncbi:MAG: HTTM domain-containing protein [Maritimibacter sp.]
MSFEAALRATEILLGFALLQASLEHVAGDHRWRAIYVVRAGAAFVLMLGVVPVIATGTLWLLTVLHLRRHHGPYNGGADKMAVLILTCLGLARVVPNEAAQELAMAYLAAQLVLSYFVSGWIKIVNPEWRRGRALVDVFRYSTYPVSARLRLWAERPRLLFVMGWAVMLLEVLFPVTLLWVPAMLAALIATASFHFANACFFGLNRFFWIWISAYPVLIWFQGRIGGGLGAS